ncbi:MAG: hypothetical protein WC222_08830 [Parachlamydiales bacterium]|jgi:hypothetical protein
MSTSSFNSSYSPSDLRTALTLGEVDSQGFKDLMDVKAFYTHPQLYTVAQDVLKEALKGNDSRQIVRVYSVLTSKDVSSLPGFFGRWGLNSSIQQCEDKFTQSFDDFFSNHTALVSKSDRNKAYFDEHLKDHFNAIEGRFKLFNRDVEKELLKDWHTVKTALIHDDYDTAKVAWDKIQRTTILHFYDKDYLTLQGCDLKKFDQQGAEIFLKEGLQKLQTYLKDAATKPQTFAKNEEPDEIEDLIESFTFVSTDIDPVEIRNEKINALISSATKFRGGSDGDLGELNTSDIDIINGALEKAPEAFRDLEVKIQNDSAQIDAFCKFLPKCTNLSTLKLDLGSVNAIEGKKILESLLALGREGKLENLHLANIKKTEVLDSFLDSLSTTTSLKELKIENYRTIEALTERQMSLIVKLVKNIANIKEIDFENTTISKAALDLLIKEIGAFQDKRLSFSANLVHPDFKSKIGEAEATPKSNLSVSWYTYRENGRWIRK